MAEEWKPEVGGRAVFCAVGSTEDVPVTVLTLHSTGKWANVMPPDGRRLGVDCADLREHPADRRARQLLEAAREVEESHKALIASMPGLAENRAVARHHRAHQCLCAILAEIDAAAAGARREEVGHG